MKESCNPPSLMMKDPALRKFHVSFPRIRGLFFGYFCKDDSVEGILGFPPCIEAENCSG